jgi:hypothetical protein
MEGSFSATLRKACKSAKSTEEEEEKALRA